MGRGRVTLVTFGALGRKGSRSCVHCQIGGRHSCVGNTSVRWGPPPRGLADPGRRPAWAFLKPDSPPHRALERTPRHLPEPEGSGNGPPSAPEPREFWANWLSPRLCAYPLVVSGRGFVSFISILSSQPTCYKSRPRASQLVDPENACWNRQPTPASGQIQPGSEEGPGRWLTSVSPVLEGSRR